MKAVEHVISTCRRYFLDPEDGNFNTFDFAIVVVSITFALNPNTDGSSVAVGRLLRLVRVVLKARARESERAREQESKRERESERARERKVRPTDRERRCVRHKATNGVCVCVCVRVCVCVCVSETRREREPDATTAVMPDAKKEPRDSNGSFFGARDAAVALSWRSRRRRAPLTRSVLATAASDSGAAIRAAGLPGGHQCRRADQCVRAPRARAPTRRRRAH